MGARELIREIEATGVRIQVEYGNLRLRGPQSAMTPTLKEQVKAHKQEVIAELLRAASSQWTEPLLGGEDTTSMSTPVPASAFPAVADPDTYYPTLGLTYGQIQGEWDSKPVMLGEQPVLKQLLEQQEWLASIDWHQGLRCGKSGNQCRACRGIPCHGSTEWQSTI